MWWKTTCAPTNSTWSLVASAPGVTPTPSGPCANDGSGGDGRRGGCDSSGGSSGRGGWSVIFVTVGERCRG